MLQVFLIVRRWTRKLKTSEIKILKLLNKMNVFTVYRLGDMYISAIS